MRRTGTSGEDGAGGSEGHDRASQLGWDDSLYERRAGVPGPRQAPEGQPAGQPIPGGLIPGGQPPEGQIPAGTAEGAPGGAPEPAPAGRRAQRAARRARKPRWRRVLVWTAGSLAFLLVGVAVAGYLYLEHLNGNLTKKPRSLGGTELAEPTPNAEGQTPLNILLMGSDSRDGAENQELGGARDLAGGPVRADVQMLLHASADRSNITVISIPRDTQVAIPECTDPDTGEVFPATASASINTALDHGGPGCVLATWEELTGIYIHHFMMVDFAGVVDMADAVGGVPVCVEANIADDKSGLRLPAGESVIEGEEALQWLRTRKGFADGSDIGRTKAQQMYLSNMVEELQASASLTNTGELMDLAEAATNALTVNHELGSVQALYDLGTDLRQVPNNRINMVTLPWLPDPANPNVTIIPDPAKAPELFEMVRTDVPLDDQDAEPAPEETSDGPTETVDAEPSPPAEVAVTVRNATGSDIQGPANGRAGVLTDELLRLGYAQTFTDSTAAAPTPDTEVQYAEEDQRPNAEALAETLGIPADRVLVSPEAQGVVLVVGDDWREGTVFPAEAVEEAEANETEAAGDDPAIAEEDIISGSSGGNCMPVNPLYTW
ncbi:LCP family protein [Streptomyces sp. DSM 44915]|uniref:LCP family protein n=1 Tax=Streptomyces chisholmiae TaxID=3075540 RepID=A0ABU2K0X4_9ACTN|nr:LCP family protein [Streptomyces sp. DSM 44915]MDT0270727.1 LCP family protein [Streptomyces sp. DSM 44915]